MTEKTDDKKNISLLSALISIYLKRKFLFFASLLIFMLLIAFLITLNPQEQYWRQQTQEIQQHYEQWTKQKISNYQINIHWTSYPENCRQEIMIKNLLTEKVIKNNCKYSGSATIEGLFSLVKGLVDMKKCGGNGCDCDGPFIMDVIYDEKYGFPKIAKPAYHPEERWRFGGIGPFASVFCTMLGDLSVGWEINSFIPLQ